jgi:GDP-L-fucose synthase
MTPLRVLVTGASGVIGTATVDELARSGYEVVAVASSDGDLRNIDAADRVMATHRPEAIVHLAAHVGGLMGNARAQGEMYFDNVLINTNVIESARRHGVGKIVAMGSVAIYPDDIPLPMRESDIWSGQPHHSEAGYAHAKRAMLGQLEAYERQYGLEFAFAVSTNLFGPNDRFDEQRGHVFPSLMSKFHRGVTEGDTVTVWGTGKATRDFLYSKDAAAALRTLLEFGSGVYNVASGAPITISELVAEMAIATDFHGEIAWDATKPDGQAARGYDITRIAALGWAPQIPLRLALDETYEWYVGHVDSLRR